MLCSRHVTFARTYVGTRALLNFSSCLSPNRCCSSVSKDEKKSSFQQPVARDGRPPDLELREVEPLRPAPVIRKFDTVKLPGTRRRPTPERVAFLARIDELFAHHERTRAGFVTIVEEYRRMDKTMRGHPEFINTAVEKMEEFGVHKDVEMYQLLIDCFPRGPYLPKSVVQEALPTTFPQTEAAIRLVKKMDISGVLPNFKIVDGLGAVLGWRSMPAQIALGLGWWKSMLQDNNQYYIPGVEHYRPFLMAGFVLKRMAGKAAVVQVVRREPGQPGGRPWILAIQSRRQAARARAFSRTDLPLFVEGPRLIYMENVPHYYYVLLLDSSVSDADSDDPGESTAISVSITPTGCGESIAAWVESVKKKYPVLEDCKIFFNQKPLPDSPYKCFPDISEPLVKGSFPHHEDGAVVDREDIDEQLLTPPID